MLGRTLALAGALTVGALTPVLAQMMPGGAPPMMGGAPMGAPPMMGGQPQEPPCFKDFLPLRQDAEKKAAAVRAANEKKASPQEACSLIGKFSEAEAKVISFVEKNGAWCGIPDQVVAGMKTNHEHTVQLHKQVCMIAANPPKPAGPSLSDALDPSNLSTEKPKPGRGTFDTLTGNALAR